MRYIDIKLTIIIIGVSNKFCILSIFIISFYFSIIFSALLLSSIVILLLAVAFIIIFLRNSLLSWSIFLSDFIFTPGVLFFLFFLRSVFLFVIIQVLNLIFFLNVCSFVINPSFSNSAKYLPIFLGFIPRLFAISPELAFSIDFKCFNTSSFLVVFIHLQND